MDGPESLTGVRRAIVNFKWLSLTDLTVKVARNARQKSLKAAWAAGKVQEAWAATAWAKKIASKAAKAALTDFGRFQAKAKASALRKKVVAKLGVAA